MNRIESPGGVKLMKTMSTDGVTLLQSRLGLMPKEATDSVKLMEIDGRSEIAAQALSRTDAERIDGRSEIHSEEPAADSEKLGEQQQRTPPNKTGV